MECRLVLHIFLAISVQSFSSFCLLSSTPQSCFPKETYCSTHSVTMVTLYHRTLTPDRCSVLGLGFKLAPHQLQKLVVPLLSLGVG